MSGRRGHRSTKSVDAFNADHAAPRLTLQLKEMLAELDLDGTEENKSEDTSGGSPIENDLNRKWMPEFGKSSPTATMQYAASLAREELAELNDPSVTSPHGPPSARAKAVLQIVENQFPGAEDPHPLERQWTAFEGADSSECRIGDVVLLNKDALGGLGVVRWRSSQDIRVEILDPPTGTKVVGSADIERVLDPEEILRAAAVYKSLMDDFDGGSFLRFSTTPFQCRVHVLKDDVFNPSYTGSDLTMAFYPLRKEARILRMIKHSATEKDVLVENTLPLTRLFFKGNPQDRRLLCWTPALECVKLKLFPNTGKKISAGNSKAERSSARWSPGTAPLKNPLSPSLTQRTTKLVDALANLDFTRQCSKFVIARLTAFLVEYPSHSHEFPWFRGKFRAPEFLEIGEKHELPPDRVPSLLKHGRMRFLTLWRDGTLLVLSEDKQVEAHTNLKDQVDTIELQGDGHIKLSPRLAHDPDESRLFRGSLHVCLPGQSRKKAKMFCAVLQQLCRPRKDGWEKWLEET